jgi:cobalamin biosynthesis Mg chelatase CobN
MKRQILSLATALVLMTAGAVFAQSTLNTTAPGPSQETKPGQTNNNLQNPGSHNQQPTTTTTTTATAPSTATVTSTDMKNDSTSSTVTPPADTTTTNTYNGSTGTAATSSTLPKTASDLPTVALMGLLALSGFFALRVYAKRNA